MHHSYLLAIENMNGIIGEPRYRMEKMSVLPVRLNKPITIYLEGPLDLLIRVDTTGYEAIEPHVVAYRKRAGRSLSPPERRHYRSLRPSILNAGT